MAEAKNDRQCHQNRHRINAADDYGGKRSAGGHLVKRPHLGEVALNGVAKFRAKFADRLKPV